MRKERFFLATVEFLFASLLVLAGAFLISLYYVPVRYFEFIAWLTGSLYSIVLLGIFLLAVGILLLWACASLQRTQYYQLRLSSHKAEVDLKVIQEMVNTVLTAFGKGIACQVVLEGKKQLNVEVFTEAPLQEQQKLLEHLDQTLPLILEEYLGYDLPITVCMNSEKI
ncbi:MAG: hypothetical protein RLZZ453_639 [Chlamydiota bacterium]